MPKPSIPMLCKQLCPVTLLISSCVHLPPVSLSCVNYSAGIYCTMGITYYHFSALVNFVVNAAAQFSQVTQSLPGQPPEYVAGTATSRVAAPVFTPTLVYNCYYMPLICENVASYAKSINPNGGGDLGGPQLFHFDPKNTSKNARRSSVCGCFIHDDCVNAVSNGKSNGAKVTDIANQPPFDTLNIPMSQADMNIILAGTNPKPPKLRVPLPSVPGRFFGVSGVAFSCDEFPAATFIEGGIGINSNGNRAKTICAMQSWQIYSAAKAPGKWPLIANSGQSREQDWQATSHSLLRVSRSAPTLASWLIISPSRTSSLKVVDWGPSTRLASPQLLFPPKSRRKHTLSKLPL